MESFGDGLSCPHRVRIPSAGLHGRCHTKATFYTVFMKAVEPVSSTEVTAVFSGNLVPPLLGFDCTFGVIFAGSNDQGVGDGKDSVECAHGDGFANVRACKFNVA